MSSTEDVRRIALSLPAVSERDHHGRPSFRVGEKIFATLWDETHANLMLDQAGIRTAAQRLPDACSERYWGERLAALTIDLATVTEETLRELIADAWENKSPTGGSDG